MLEVSLSQTLKRGSNGDSQIQFNWLIKESRYFSHLTHVTEEFHLR